MCQKKYIIILEYHESFKKQNNDRLRIQTLTSSTNIMTGASLLANEKRALVSFSASPNHCIRKKTNVNKISHAEEANMPLNNWNNT